MSTSRSCKFFKSSEIKMSDFTKEKTLNSQNNQKKNLQADNRIN